ncbi:MAG: DUF4266 domain-containing protein [Gammaproteobacteria bacterium]|nr:DUF4266 domain-containing protein [Gammaproteobacteria bacterium]MDH5729756.1 DUF4266 domain-containing protein [Gammaproteobacteria bacterium]
MYSIKRILLISSSLFLLGGCSLLPNIAPWDRDLLAQDKMLVDKYRMEMLGDDKAYFSREAARGGQNFGGGGCGCN